MDYVYIIRPRTVDIALGGQVVTVEKLRLVDWFRLARIERRLLDAFFGLQPGELLIAALEFLELATGRDISDADVEECLVAFSSLWELNEVSYVDSFFWSDEYASEDEVDKLEQAAEKQLPEDLLLNSFLLDLEVTLACRFSLDEVRDMYIEQALLYYQRIKEDQADDRSVVYWSTEFGYDRKEKKAGKTYKTQFKPRESPYEVFWRKRRRRLLRKARRDLMLEVEAPPSPFIKHPEKVVDLARRSRR